MSIVLISNMNSWRNIRDRLRVYWFKKIIGNDGEVFATKSVEHLERVMQDLPRSRPKTVILDTGDGGVCRYAGLLVKHWSKPQPYPELAVLRGGRFNFLARQCGVRKKRRDLKEYIRRIISNEGVERQPIDFMRIKDNNDVENYGFSFGLGAVVTLLEEVYKRKRWGWAGVVRVMGRLYVSRFWEGGYYSRFNKKTALEAVVNADGQEQHYDGNYLMLMAQTIKSIGLARSETFYKVQEGDKSAKKFHTRGLTCKLTEAMRIINIAKIYDGSKFGSLDTLADSLCISSERPVRYQINGELNYRVKKRPQPYEAHRIDIEQGITLETITFNADA